MICTCFCSVDKTDCKIHNPTPFNSKWFLHKFCGPRVKCKVGISINTRNVVWVHGPFACETWPDINIFKQKLAAVILDDKEVVTDGAYQHVKCITPDNVGVSQKSLHPRILARHKSCNAQLKYFNVVSHTFRHNVKLL